MLGRPSDVYETSTEVLSGNSHTLGPDLRVLPEQVTSLWNLRRYGQVPVRTILRFELLPDK